MSVEGGGEERSAVRRIWRCEWEIHENCFTSCTIDCVASYKWSVTLREEHRLGVFENRVLRRIFGPKRDELTGEWRKLHNKELHELYFSASIIKIIK
jgi:hypothetical protein